jgi:hypothetical protein
MIKTSITPIEETSSEHWKKRRARNIELSLTSFSESMIKSHFPRRGEWISRKAASTKPR